MKIETKCLHSGYTPKNGEPRVVPIVQSTTYRFDSCDHVAELFDNLSIWDKVQDWLYEKIPFTPLRWTI